MEKPHREAGLSWFNNKAAEKNLTQSSQRRRGG